MPDMAIAIGFHLLGVVWWIGGLAFVTLVFLPLARAGEFGEIEPAFHKLEARFAPQVKAAMMVVGLSGLYMLWRTNGWSGLLDPHKWWLDAMLLYWLWFALMLFVLGPSGVLKKMMKGSANSAQGWQRLHVIHGVLLAIGLGIIFAAAGRYFF